MLAIGDSLREFQRLNRPHQQDITSRYCTPNWSSRTAPLRKRGSLSVWLNREVTWLAPHDGVLGRPAVFSEAAIPVRKGVDVVQPVMGCFNGNDLPAGGGFG